MGNPKRKPVFAKAAPSAVPPPPPPPVPAPKDAWSRHRWIISGELTVVSPLHIGTGSPRPAIPAMQAGTNDPIPEVAAIQRDDANNPYIPGSTLKGLLLRLGRAVLTPDQTSRLFGTIKSEGSGAMGALFVRGATQTRAGDATGMPYVNIAAEALGGGVYIAMRTAIDGASGTAAHARLFSREMVAPGAQFAFSLLLETAPGTSGEQAQELLSCVAALLEILRSTGGESIGAGQADGMGRVRIAAPVTYRRVTLGADGRLIPAGVTAPIRAQTATREQTVWGVRLLCDGPFLIADSSHRPPGNREHADGAPADRLDPAAAQVSAQRRGRDGDVPLLPGESLMGALRARAKWLCALHGGAPPGRLPLPKPLDFAALSPIDRLFGVTGFRGLLALGRLDVRGAARWSYTSVKLDRFSGAPIDQQLFGTAAFIDVKVDLTLVLAGRGAAGGPGMPTTEDEGLARMLMQDLAKNGLMLGHGGNRGFGWFTCLVSGPEVKHV
jgi:CRISPR/Cas system CSM-associated protein Csm3 (group 7 of RAMP superfamily)